MADHKIQWNGLVDDSELDSLASADNNEVPTSVDIVWGGYVPCWADENNEISQERVDNCVIADMLFEDFDINQDGNIDALDVTIWYNLGRIDIAIYIIDNLVSLRTLSKAPRSTYTWGDVAFVLEIFDGIGTGSRRAREKRLQDLDKDKKKRLIHLICRVKGVKVYDEKKKAGNIQIKLEDAELVIERVLGKMRVENANVL